MKRSVLSLSIVAAALLAACAPSGSADDQASKASADSAKKETAKAESTAAPAAAPAPATASAPARPAMKTLAAGTTIRLEGVTDVTSQKHEAGMAYTARVTTAVKNARGETIIPAGALMTGTVTTLVAAGSPSDSGHLAIALTMVRIRDHDLPIQTRIVSLATRQVSRGITATDAAKVGAGAAAGAVAGRVIGGNRTGTVVGAVAGGAAGAVVANRTKDHDIVLSPGSAIVAEVAQPFSMVP